VGYGPGSFTDVRLGGASGGTEVIVAHIHIYYKVLLFHVRKRLRH